MTNLEAIKHYIEPYEVSDGKLELLLSEQGLQITAIYNGAANKTPMYRAIIKALTSLMTLKKEKDNGSELDYDVNALKDLIKGYKREIGEVDETKPLNRDMTPIW